METRANASRVSDDYHHISEQLNRAAEKINKTKLSISLQDKDKPSSHLSESDEENLTELGMYPYDDGKVQLKKVMCPTSSWDSCSGEEEGKYLMPRESPLKRSTTPTK